MNSQAEKDTQWLLQEKYGGEKSEGFFIDCKQLALGEPLGYLIGHVPFLDCTIHLDSRPLVPRPETEHWVEKAIEVIAREDEQDGLFGEAGGLTDPKDQSSRPPVRVLDLCAGSGCIGVAVAKHVPCSQVDFIEIDKDHLDTITKNILSNEIAEERIQVIHSNLFGNLPNETKYDFILSNPPYIDPALQRVDENVKDFEPHVALFGGKGGVEVIGQIIAAAGDHLKTGGQLWLEHEPEQVGAISEYAAQYGFSSTTYRDQYKMQRYSVLVVE